MNRLTVSLILLFLALIWGIFFVMPKNEDLNLLRQNIQEKRAELQSKESYLATLTQLSQKLHEYKDSLDKIDSAIPDSPELPALFSFLQRAASQSGLILTKLDMTSAPVKSSSKSEIGVNEIRLNLILSGSYSAFKNFLYTLEKSSRLIEVESFVLTAEEKQVNVKIQLKVHSL
jgi:type IV pilus assembly protein PilO